MQQFSNLYNFSSYLIRKYRNTNISILELDLNESNGFLKGCKIETVN